MPKAPWLVMDALSQFTPSLPRLKPRTRLVYDRICMRPTILPRLAQCWLNGHCQWIHDARTPVDLNVRPSHIAAEPAGQKAGDARDLLRPSAALEADDALLRLGGLEGRRRKLLRHALHIERGEVHAHVDLAGGNAVDADIRACGCIVRQRCGMRSRRTGQRG